MDTTEDKLPYLTPDKQAFVTEYLIDEDVQQAALRAGFYTNELEGTTGSQLMDDPDVARAIAIALAQRKTRVAMTQATVLHEMSLLAASSIDHYAVDDEGNVALTALAPTGAMRAIQSVKRKIITKYDPSTKVTTKEVNVEIKLWDKPTPLKIMGKQIGLFPDKVEHSGPGGGPIETVTRVERVVVDPKQESL